jgi:hypothetical protein
MNEVGDGCYPSIARLVAETGLSNRAVTTHIAKAAVAGWVQVSKHGFAGQRWKRSEYRAAWPKGSEPGSPRLPEGGERRSEGGEPNDKKVVKEVHSILPLNIPKNLPGDKPPPP